MTNLPQVRERIGAADFQTVAKFLPQAELGGTLAVSENEKAVVMRGGRVVDMFSGRSGRTQTDSEVVVASLRDYHMVFGFGDCSRSPYNRAPAMIHVADLPEIEASSGEILRSMTVAIRFSLIRDDRSNVDKLLALNAARRDAITVRDLANGLDLPAFISATFASVETSGAESIRFDKPYTDKVSQQILAAANIALGEYGISASAAALDIYATSRDAPRRLTESQREELAKHNSRMTQLDAQIEAEKRRIELENLSNQREMLRTATMKHLEEQAEIQARIESLDPRPPSQTEPTKPRPPAPSAEPPSKPRNRMPLIAAGFFGAIIAIILAAFLMLQSGDSAPDSPPPIAAVATPTSTPTPSPVPTATPLPTNTPTPIPTATPSPSPIDDRDALIALYNATDGANWTNNDNWLSDRPIGEWLGVEVDDNGRVVRLDFIYNNLSGEIPSALGDLANLESLSLWNNNLSGKIPPALGGLANLEHLSLLDNNLSGEIPPTLGDLANLQIMHLFDNELSGEIPPTLGNLSNLKVLLLSGNNLSGCIPDGLRDVADNDFSQLNLPFCEP